MKGLTHETHERTTWRKYFKNDGDNNPRYAKVRSPYGWLYWKKKSVRQLPNSNEEYDKTGTTTSHND